MEKERNKTGENGADKLQDGGNELQGRLVVTTKMIPMIAVRFANNI